MSETIHIPQDTPWLPPALCNNPEPVRHVFRFSSAERKILRKRKQIRPSLWVERYRVLTMSVLPGKWKNETTPYLAGIMDASFFPSVRVIVICAPPQSGKSECVSNCIGYAVDRAPGPALLVYPDEKTSDENCEDRFQPMITSSRRLRSYTTGLADDLAKKRIKLQHMPIYFGWARSASALANKPCRYAVNDEVDKYPETAGKRESGPIQLTAARLITYAGQEKHWIISTPSITTGPIWRAYNAAPVRFELLIECPACGTLHLMEFGQIKWPRKSEPGPDGKHHSEEPEIIEERDLAWYECPHCLAELTDYDRDLAVRRGRWQDRETGIELHEYLEMHRPKKIAFQYPSWISRFVPLSKPAAAFLRGQKDFTEFKDFKNKHEAKPWKLTTISTDEEKILAARCPLPAQTVPEDAIALTCGIDVQKFGFWFAVRAWAPVMTSWLIHYGFLATWGEVETLLFDTVYPAEGPAQSKRIWRAAVDTGGGKKYENMTMTEETYFWLIKNRGRGGMALWGTKGSSSNLAGMLSLGNTITTTPAGKKLAGGLRILSVDTEKAKDQYHYRLNLAREGLTGGAYLHADTGPDYAAQILAEEKQISEKGVEEWINPHSRPNHLSDAELLAAACVEMEFPGGGLRILAEAMKQREKQPAGTEPQHQPTPPGQILEKARERISYLRRPSWLDRR